MTELPPRIDKHEATDRIGAISMRTVHELGAALTDSPAADVEPVVVRRGGPHRSIDGLAALIDAALADEAPPDPHLPS
jgi:hypothetical protein